MSRQAKPLGVRLVVDIVVLPLFEADLERDLVPVVNGDLDVDLVAEACLVGLAALLGLADERLESFLAGGGHIA